MSRLKVAITGAGGQIGSFLTERLSAQHPELEVVAICRNTVSAGLLDITGCSVRVGSITEPDSAFRLLEDCDAIIHCALAVGLPRESRLSNEAMIQSISRPPKVKTIVYLSSVAVYGSCINSTINTYTRPVPDTSYGKDKLSGEQQVLAVFAKAERRYFVLRLGHVYGPQQTISRTILTWVQDEYFRLPFDGHLMSNAIHIDSLGDAIICLLSNTQASGIYNLTDQPHQTWRQIFDWHTNAVGLPAMRGMSMEESEKIKAQCLKRKWRPLPFRFIGEGARWMRSVPSQLVYACPSLRELAYSVLVRTPVSWEQRLKTIYRRMSVEREVQASVSSESCIEPELWLLSDPMPGPYLEFAPASNWNSSDQMERKKRLARWFNKWAYPTGAWIV
jgi:nucleoside-diphosphate-sugar epimerase